MANVSSPSHVPARAMISRPTRAKATFVITNTSPTNSTTPAGSTTAAVISGSSTPQPAQISNSPAATIGTISIRNGRPTAHTSHSSPTAPAMNTTTATIATYG